MIYTSARWADEAHTMVTGTDAEGRSETVPADHSVFRLLNEGPTGFVRKKSEGGVGGTIGAYIAPPAPTVTPSKPDLFAAVAIQINDGVLSVIEQAAQLSSAAYEDGWAFIVFTEARPSADYLIFAQTDVPAKIEQFKEPGYFELVFSDPNTGDPINPGRIDIQLLEVR